MEKMLRLMLQSGLYYKKFFKTQKPRLINESSFKSRAGYNGVRTVDNQKKKPEKPFYLRDV